MFEREQKESYDQKLIEAGLLVHKEARVPELLRELEEAIKPNLSDVRIGDPILMGDGTVSLGID